MHPRTSPCPTVGFLSTWSVYEGTAIDGYTTPSSRGLRRGPRAGLQPAPRLWHEPAGESARQPHSLGGAGAGVDFCPVGPWNADGLIVIPDDLSDAQFEYVQDLIRSGYRRSDHPRKNGPLVAVDNAGGIHQAFDHLCSMGTGRLRSSPASRARRRHGGTPGRLSGSAARRWRRGGSTAHCLWRAIDAKDGRVAMQHISRRSAVHRLLASNDLSALGAIEVLHTAGRASQTT